MKDWGGGGEREAVDVLSSSLFPLNSGMTQKEINSVGHKKPAEESELFALISKLCETAMNSVCVCVCVITPFKTERLLFYIYFLSVVITPKSVSCPVGCSMSSMLRTNLLKQNQKHKKWNKIHSDAICIPYPRVLILAPASNGVEPTSELLAKQVL